ncbi:MAG TPA: glycosyltransferase family 39 protein [Acidobacteriota bacterium]|nr:glycosyltransferase family 39 protein [Acidobacteriota bacterium]
MTAPRALLILVMGIYLAAGAAFSVVFPLGEGPDEPAHFAYVQYVARHVALPVLKPNYLENTSVEAYQAPLYYVMGAVLTFPWMGTDPAVSFDPPTGEKRPLFSHTAEAAFPWSGGTLAWHLLRFFSLALGACSLLASYGILFWFFDSQWLATAGTAYLALNPQFIYMHSLVSNDSMAILAGTLLLLYIVRAAQDPARLEPFIAGLALTFALLSKASVPLLAGGLAYLLWLRRSQLASSWPHGLRNFARLAAAPVLLAGWWLVRNLWLYGDLTGASMSMRVVPENHYPTPLGTLEFLRLLPEIIQATFRTSWATFGWMGFELPRRISNAIAIVHLAAWGVVLLSIRPKMLRCHSAVALTLSALGLLAGFCYYNTFTNQAGWQGRLLFPAASIAAVVFVAGWRRFFPGRDAWAAALLVTAEMALLAHVFFSIVLPTFAG